MEGLLLLPVGLALGFFGGVFGIGGGIIAIPMLVLWFGLEQSTAQGTALVLMVPNLLVAFWRYTRRYPVGWLSALAIAVPASVTTWGLAHFATRLDPLVLRIVFCVAMAVLAWRMFRLKSAVQENVEHIAPDWKPLPWIGVAGGCSMGLLGIGGGLVATPLLSGWLGFRQTVAQSLALALVAPASVVALTTYATAGKVNWEMGLPLALGGLVSVSAGVAFAHRLPERRLRRGFAMVLLLTALVMLPVA